MPGSQSFLLGLTERLEHAEALDGTSSRLQRVVKNVLPEGPARGLLAGSWMGHALHPLLTDVPIGTWTSSIILDVAGGESSESAADLLIGVGLAAVAPTALTGWSDWSEIGIENRRVGLVHAGVNITAASCFAASLTNRRRGRRATGRLLSLAGAAALGVGGYLGGHLSYARSVGTGER
ncbi:MAG TPA: DUF2231 domain-containing protein [Solirubrobacteraceae bacterium]